jgi:hypothetical protein
MIDQVITDRHGHYCILRITERERQRLERHLFQRYPDREWGTFFRFGFRRVPWGIALSYVEALWPEAGELNEESGITTFQSDYTLRAFRMVERRDIALGVAHSHPRGGGTFPSELDDDMDGYFAEELSAYSAGMPYCSLILQRSGASSFTFTGRVYDRGVWLPVREMLTIGGTLARERAEDELCIVQSMKGTATADRESTTARLASVFGAAGQHRLAATTVGVIGCGGTGSPAIHVLARAGVGRFVLIDPERLSPSNLERLHGSTSEDVCAAEPPYKVDVMSRMIRAINPIAEVIVLKLNALDERALDELICCDLVLGCVDTQHARVLLSDLAKHYLIPSMDLGVLMEGNAGQITSQIGEITQYRPELPCAFCCGRIDFLAVSRELMDATEREQRIVAAQEAADRGEDAHQYWAGEAPQLHTVGYLTTMLGSLAAGYAEGWLTGAFAMPHSCMQFDVGQPRFGFVAVPRQPRANCRCQDHVGWADQAAAVRNIALPDHWRAEFARR